MDYSLPRSRSTTDLSTVFLYCGISTEINAKSKKKMMIIVLKMLNQKITKIFGLQQLATIAGLYYQDSFYDRSTYSIYNFIRILV